MKVTGPMIHFCFLDKKCREFSWQIHFRFTKKYHYQLEPPVDRDLIDGGIRFQRPSLRRIQVPRAVWDDSDGAQTTSTKTVVRRITRSTLNEEK